MFKFSCALLALSLSTATVLAAPAKAPVSSRPAKVSIAPATRTVLARATKFYGAAQGLSARWVGQIDDDKIVNSSLDFDRAGRLRLVNCNSFEPLIVIDGKSRWSLEASEINAKGRAVYTKVEADKSEALVEMALIAPGLSNILGDLLVKSSPLDAKQVEAAVELYGLRAFRAVTLAPQPLNSQTCDLVRITFVSSTFVGRERIEQKTYWFARSDGRLMRLQDKITHGGKPKSHGDWQMTAQTFNPTFAPDTFKFVPPKGAVLAK